MSEKKNCEISCCASISLKKMYYFVSMMKSAMLSGEKLNEKEFLNYLDSLEHEIKLMNDENNHIDRDIYR